MQANIQSHANEALIKELLDMMVNDSENLGRFTKLLTGDCVWVMEPGGTEYHGSDQIEAFVEIAMSSRTHDGGQHKVEVQNWFTTGDDICIEYSHGLIMTGSVAAGIKGSIKTGVLRYCITYHLRDGMIDQVHEFINATTWWINAVMPIGLGYLHRLAMRKLATEAGSQRRPFGITLVAGLMILFGLAEVVTAFTHNFFGITTSGINIFTYTSAVIGAFYVASGLLILSMRRRAAALAIVLLIADILGRIALTASGLYPTDSFKQTFAIITGTAIAGIFAVYIAWKWRSFR